MGTDQNKVYLPSPDQSPTTGAIQLGKVGVAAAPTDARAQPGSTWTDSLGYVGTDGITIAGLIASGDAVREWAQGVVRMAAGQAEPTLAIPSIQVDATLAKLLVGDANVTVAQATSAHGEQIHISFDGKPGPARALVASMRDENRRVRVYCPSVQVKEIDDLSFVPTAANTFAMTLSLNQGPDGKYVHLLYDDGATTDSVRL